MKKKNARLDITRILIAVTAVICIAMIGKGVAVSPIIAANNEMAVRIQEDIDKENRHIEELDAALESAGTDEYIEKIAREKLGMIKANEIVFIDISGQ